MEAKLMAGGTQRHGRNKKKCERYRAEGRREKNKARRVARRAAWLEKREAKRRAKRAAA
jgi:hypothetical protein